MSNALKTWGVCGKPESPSREANTLLGGLVIQTGSFITQTQVSHLLPSISTSLSRCVHQQDMETAFSPQVSRQQHRTIT